MTMSHHNTHRFLSGRATVEEAFLSEVSDPATSRAKDGWGADASADLLGWIQKCQRLEAEISAATSDAAYWKRVATEGSGETFDCAEVGHRRRSSSMTRRRSGKRQSQDSEWAAGGRGGSSAGVSPHRHLSSSNATDPTDATRNHHSSASSPLSSETDEALRALRRKHAALNRKVKQVEEEHAQEVERLSTQGASLFQQVQELRHLLQESEAGRLELEARHITAESEARRLRDESTNLMAQVAALSTENRVLLKSSEDLHTSNHERALTDERRANERLSEILMENAALKEQMTSLRTALESATVVSESHAKEVTLLEAALGSAKQALKDATAGSHLQQVPTVAHDEPSAHTATHSATTGDALSATSASHIFQRLQSVVAAAERAAHTCAQGGVLELAKRIQLAETLTKTADQYAAMLHAREAQLKALLTEMENCETVGWRLSSEEARRVLVEVMLERGGGMEIPPPRVITLRATGDGVWKELRDTRLNVVYYVTTSMEQTPFSSLGTKTT